MTCLGRLMSPEWRFLSLPRRIPYRIGGATLERGFGGKQRKAVDSLATLICWSIWKQRNARVFGNTSKVCNEDVLAARVVEDMKLWVLAGAVAGDFHLV